MLLPCGGVTDIIVLLPCGGVLPPLQGESPAVSSNLVIGVAVWIP